MSQDVDLQLSAAQRETTVSRLRSSRIRRPEELFRDGVESGISWAMHSAAIQELQSIADFMSSADREHCLASAASVAARIRPHDESNERAERCWKEIAGDRWTDAFASPMFRRGFIGAAHSVWLEVRQEVMGEP
jgi:hypothetical protein